MATEPEYSRLDLPSTKRVVFAHNLIKLTVCELRFPHLIEYETKPPLKLQKAVRKTYPLYRKTTEVSLSPGDVGREIRYMFDSKKKDWTLTFKPNALALETKAYSTFEDFWKRLVAVLKPARAILDSDFYTRVGLRYVNWIPVGEGSDLEGWINPDLAPALVAGTYGTVTHFRQTVHGLCDGGRYSLRHGLETSEEGSAHYLFDADFFEESVEDANLETQLRKFNEQNFRLFSWALGDKARESMGASKVKKGG